MGLQPLVEGAQQGPVSDGLLDEVEVSSVQFRNPREGSVVLEKLPEVARQLGKV